MVPTLAEAGGHALSFIAVPFRPQTYRNLLYLSLAFPLGFVYVLFVSLGVSFGLALAVVVVGIPLLALVLAVTLGVAGVERRLTAALLGVEFTPRPRPAGGFFDRLRAVVTDLSTWAALLYLPARFAFGVASFVLVMNTLVTGVALLFVPFYYDQPGLYVGVVSDRPVEFHPALYLGWDRLLVGVETVVTLDAWRVDTAGEAAAVAAVGVGVCLVGLHLLNWLARANGWLAERLLGGTYGPLAAVRHRPADAE
ncbi:sensor domain-containing protein [Candidatus Halobonum tyrrellensis]|uniref:Putative sensor domain-containing protein n=1 Tax=Candidatus Halobonum tyrrellensis G22 TaxID=1324957 RepID=V4HQ53_9EURY|nr:sensor domain-containing protein [Candidatus Halobonum tyrrellensis]ESP90044.1 hypothetical protein K933_00737 [Candidatus Halobonum tyrrellensis G22]